MASERKEHFENGEPVENDVDQSQSISHSEIDESRQSQIDSKKPQKMWGERQSEVRKVLINNRQKQKLYDTDHSYDGVYLYKPGVELPSLFHLSNHTIKIIIASQYLNKHNPEVMKRTIYGSDTYTSDSDCVCIAIHAGYINPTNFPSKRYQGIELSCKVIKPKKTYIGTLKNFILSRSTKTHNGNALKPDGWKHLTSLGPMDMLEKYASNMHIPIGKSRVRRKPKNIGSIIPIPQTHLVFNVNNQPAYKYSIFNLADKGYEKGEFLTKKLDSNVLYIETSQGQKYELFKEFGQTEVYHFGKLKCPREYDNTYFSKNKSPLTESEVEPVQQNLEWSEILWGNTTVKIRSKVISNLISFKYYKREGK